jgi:hypothetical protein
LGLIELTGSSFSAVPAGCSGATVLQVKADSQVILQPTGIPDNPSRYTYAWTLFDSTGAQIATATTRQFIFNPIVANFPYYVKLGIADSSVTGGCIGLICIQIGALPGIICPTVTDLCKGTLTTSTTYTVTSSTGKWPAGTTYAWILRNGAGTDLTANSAVTSSNTASIKIDWRKLPSDTYMLSLVVTMSGKTYACERTIKIADVLAVTISEITPA